MAEELARFPFVPTGGSPLVVERAEGAYLHTRDGRTILDAAGGAVAVNVGHGRREVAERVARATARESYVVPLFATESRLALVSRLQERWLPPGLARIAFASGGSEAVDLALRLARQHHVSAGRPSRWKILSRELSYHGATLSTLAIGGHPRRRRAYEPLLLDLPKAPACYCTRCPFDATWPSCGVACAEAVEEAILREGPETVAAFVAEPVVGSTAGALVPPPDYWPRVAEICRRHGVLLVADEVMTGFGRTGRRFALEHWGVVPDVLVAGKGLAGGYAPIVGVFASEAVMAPLAARRDDVMFYTFGGHPAACAAADAVLEILEREDLVRRAAEVGERLRKRLAVLEEHPHVLEVRGLGMLLGVEIVRDKTSGEPFPETEAIVTRILVSGLSRGVFFYPGGAGAARHVVVLGPPFTIGDEEIERIATTLAAAIDDAVGRVGAERKS